MYLGWLSLCTKVLGHLWRSLTLLNCVRGELDEVKGWAGRFFVSLEVWGELMKPLYSQMQLRDFYYFLVLFSNLFLHVLS